MLLTFNFNTMNKQSATLQEIDTMIQEAKSKNLTELEEHVFSRYLGIILLNQEANYNAVYIKSTENPPHKIILKDEGDELDMAINSLGKKWIIIIKDDPK